MKDTLKEERIMILEMVKEGKINADDAGKLLGSLQATNATSPMHDEDFEDKLNKFYGSVDTFAKDLKCKLGKAYDSAEPKMKSAAKKIMEKTSEVMGDIQKNLNESITKMESSREDECCKDEDDCDECGK